MGSEDGSGLPSPVGIVFPTTSPCSCSLTNCYCYATYSAKLQLEAVSMDSSRGVWCDSKYHNVNELAWHQSPDENEGEMLRIKQL